MELDDARALAWRLRRHALEPSQGSSAVEVVRRVLAVRGWPARTAALAVGIRLASPDPEGLSRGLDNGDLVRSYAFRGGSYVLPPDVASALLTVRTATRVWETRRYQDQGGFALDDWQPFRETMAEMLAAGPLTRSEISERLGRTPHLAHLAAAARGSGADSLYKPLHWWGDICFGPSRDGEATFRLLHGPYGFTGVQMAEAGTRAVTDYLRSYGPATVANLESWLTDGLSVPRRLVAAWVAELRDHVAEVRIGGRTAMVQASDLTDLAAVEPSDAVRLVPGFDPWVMGPGTADERIVPAAHRADVTRGADLVLQGGVLAGTWRARGGTAEVSWFPEAGPLPRAALEEQVDTVSRILDTRLQLAVLT